MWPVQRPKVATLDVIESCRKGLHDRDLAQRLRQCESLFQEFSQKYDSSLSSNNAAQLKKETSAGAALSDQEIRGLYGARLSKKGSNPRAHYDKILANARNRRCSYCQTNTASTLDHYIPKSVNAVFSLEPLNLVPCCDQCNRKKSDTFDYQRNHGHLHPYFLNEDIRWLRATISNIDPIVISYFAGTSQSLLEGLQEDLSRQFKLLDIGTRIEDHMVAHYGPIAKKCDQLRQEGGSRLVKRHLAEMTKLRFSFDINDPIGVAYEALQKSDSFCDGDRDEPKR